MSVEIEPLELSFRRPFTAEVARTLTLKNSNTTPVAFKVKTTAPKQYCVRPNAGRIEPGQSFDVSVLLQAMKADPEPDAKCRDKFLVQSAPITADKEFASIASVLDTTDKTKIVERKIRVTWLARTSEDSGTQGYSVATPSKSNTSLEAADTPEASRTFTSPSSASKSATSSAPPPYSDETPSEPEAKSALAAAASTASATAQMTYEELKAQLAQAEAQVASYRENSGLRQRAGKGTTADKIAEGATEAAQAVKHTVEGVPVQIAAALCLISFLLAYFFF